MVKRIIPLILATLLCCSFTAYAEEIAAGFDYSLGYTDTQNQYYFENDKVIAIENKEVTDDPVYEWLPPGTQILLPIYVYPEDGNSSVPATSKMIKADNVTVSSKVTSGKAYVGDVTLVDGKSLKLKGVAAGMYVSIPLVKNYDKIERSNIKANFVLSVNDVTYDLTLVSLKCFIKNPVTYIERNSVYGAKTPTQFKVDRLYFGEATFDFGNNIKYTARVKGSETYHLNLDRTADANIKAMYPDAYLDFYNFMGDLDSFSSTGTLEIPINRANLSKKGEAAALYVYKIQSGKLIALGTGIVSFDAKNNKLSIKTKKLENYVLSNRALAQDISASPDSDILKSGYADLASSETSQISSASSTAASSSPQSASSVSSAAASSASRGASEDENGYVPEENYQNDNVNTGLPINTLNVSSDNPSTSGKTILPAAFAGLACASASVICLHRKG